MIKCDNYLDANGNQYYINSIVINPCAKDLWLVEYNIDKNSDCPYMLSQFGDKDLYYIDLDASSKFIILSNEDEEDYKLLRQQMKDLHDLFVKFLEDEDE